MALLNLEGSIFGVVQSCEEEVVLGKGKELQPCRHSMVRARVCCCDSNFANSFLLFYNILQSSLLVSKLCILTLKSLRNSTEISSNPNASIDVSTRF